LRFNRGYLHESRHFRLKQTKPACPSNGGESRVPHTQRTLPGSLKDNHMAIRLPNWDTVQEVMHEADRLDAEKLKLALDAPRLSVGGPTGTSGC
jgi:hypothetical protein